MDELELRIQAHELALIEVAAHIGREEIVKAIARIREDIDVSLTDEERDIRAGALGLLEDALRRFDPPAIGLHLRP